MVVLNKIVNMKNYLWTGTNKTLLAIFAATAVVFPLKASLTFSDDWSTIGQNSQIVLHGGGTGWGSDWYNNSQYNVYVSSTTPLTYPGLQTSGHTVTAANQGQGAYRYMGSQSPSSGSPMWISVLMQSTSQGNGYGGISLYNGGESGSEEFFFGQQYAQSYFGLSRVGGNNANSTTHHSGTLSYVVIELLSGIAYLWVDPATGSTAPSTGTADCSITYSSLTFDTIRLQAGSGTAEEFGNLRIGTTFGDVSPVPEPITLALPIFGGLVLRTGLARRFISRRADSVV